MDEFDIWRSANILIQTWGEEADLVATRRADALMAEGNTEGFSVWCRVANAIDDLRRQKPSASEQPN